MIKPKLVLAGLMLLAQHALAANTNELTEASICLFDPVGESGDMYALMKDYRTEIRAWGVDLKLKPFDNESVIVDKFKAGQCDAIAVTGIRARDFNQFTSTIEAVGALPEYADVRLLFEQLANAKLAKYMTQGEYEVAGIMPAGNIYTFLRDRTWAEEGLQDNLQGKKVSVFQGDSVSFEMVRQMGAVPVLVDTSSFAGKFNNGAVDITFSPSVAYEPFELYRGLTPNGVILRNPVAQLTFQMIIRKDKFPEGFGQHSREYAFERMGFAMQFIHLTEKRIPEEHWGELKLREQGAVNEMMRQARIKLREEDVYSAKMLTLLRKVRCKRDPRHFECTDKSE